jgi:uncharacterized YceG family protein
LVTIFITLIPSSYANAAVKQYGMIIANQNGAYTFYDLNDTDGRAGIETSSEGNIMVPLWRVAKLMPDLSYSYNSKTKKATVTNTNNGKKIVLTKNSKDFYYYSGAEAAGVKKSTAYPMYISSNSSSVMVHMSSLKWVMNSTTGYKFYKTADMQRGGYDTSKYSGLIVYNPYSQITGIPKSTNVTGISTTVKVTIPEGYSVAQIFNLLVSKGVSASTDYLYQALANYEFSQEDAKFFGIVPNENRCFDLEGYLYPDTYDFYRLSSGATVINKLVNNTRTKYTEDDLLKAESLGYTLDEIITLASLVEKEAGKHDLMPTVSSVIHNRLNIDMELELDASYFYLDKYLRPYIDGDINRFDDFYYTYTCAALPAGPICNPGKAAIEAALNPAQTNYLFFYSDAEGEYHFSAEYVNPEEVITESTE